MASYAPVARSNSSSAQGQPAAAEDHCNDSGGGGDSGGVRRAWWWAAGPVDSCCFCCRLRTGMGLLAASNLIYGIYFIFALSALQSSESANRISFLQEEYLITCKFLDPKTIEHCKELNEVLEQIEGTLKQLIVIFVVQGMLCFMTSAVGLWAVLYNSSRAAKVYMLSWPAHFLCWMLMALNNVHVDVGVDVGPDGTQFYTRTAYFLFLAYYFKVSWSFYQKTSRRRESARGSGSDSPDAENQEHSKEKLAIEMTRTV